MLLQVPRNYFKVKRAPFAFRASSQLFFPNLYYTAAGLFYTIWKYYHELFGAKTTPDFF